MRDTERIRGKNKKNNYGIQYLTILILGVCIAGLLGYILLRASFNIDSEFAPDLTVVDNPLMGFAPDAGNLSLCDKTSLVFIRLTWAEWEPKEGEYDISGLEERCNIAKWKKEGKHAVIRFMCDIPSDQEHMDIPGWLYEKTDKGTVYDTQLGKGYSPDYADPVFIRYHKEALGKLAEYCNRDHFVSFVELGSLGHWGEWHAGDNAGNSLMPDSKVCDEYASLYSESFVNARLLTRRNYEVVSNGNIGYYNDMVGDEEATRQWLDMLSNGGIQETSGLGIKLKPLVYFGKSEPIGGEFTSGVPMETIFGDDFGQTLQSISDSHMTFLGPKVPDLNERSKNQAYNSVLRRMGYRLYVSRLKTRYDFAKGRMNMELTFKNAGNAGFYFDWPVTVYIFDKNKEQVFWEGLDIDLRELGTQPDITAYSEIPVSDNMKEDFYIGVSVTDYEGNDRVRLAIDTGKDPEYIGNAQIIYHYRSE